MAQDADRKLRPLFFRLDPECVHNLLASLGKTLSRYAITRRLVSVIYGYRGRDASVKIGGITYLTLVMLAAGFDHNGRLVRILKSVGFGGVEIGR